MHIISLPYFQSATHYLCLLQSQPGLIWFHEGNDQCESEWMSALPTEEFSYLGNNSIEILCFDGTSRRIQGNWVDFLCQQMPRLESNGEFPFTGGLAGHLSYDLGLELHQIPSRFQPLTHPLAVVGRYDWALNINHSTQETRIIIQDGCPAEIIAQVTALTNQLTHSEAPALMTQHSHQPWLCSMSEDVYATALKKIKHYLIEGDCYQVNLTRQWSLQDSGLNDLALYLPLTQRMPAPFSVFQRSSSHSLLSVSPERFISIEKGVVTTQPIKGTRKRGANSTEDLQLKNELANSTKDRAENLMIVDLLRNDLARNAEAGSVNVDKLFEIQSFNNVHHLVSTITASMKPDTHPLKLLLDAFPGGSITGAPKKRAMEIIDELETQRRGNYCGCSFYLTADGRLNSNILIRSITMQDGLLTCSGGGGIVMDSECESEYAESEVKVKKILQAISPAE